MTMITNYVTFMICRSNNYVNSLHIGSYSTGSLPINKTVLAYRWHISTYLHRKLPLSHPSSLARHKRVGKFKWLIQNYRCFTRLYYSSALRRLIPHARIFLRVCSHTQVQLKISKEWNSIQPKSTKSKKSSRPCMNEFAISPRRVIPVGIIRGYSRENIASPLSSSRELRPNI